ncbi:MAG: radical SAM protein [Acetobacter sp.]|nr:radical SAM protein [Acetobacter sp.]
MKIQSLSIAVPANKCINDCKFCVSKMHCGDYLNRIDTMNEDFPTVVNEYLARLNYARDNGCNAVMLTGNCEPQQNRSFLRTLGFIFRMMNNSFRQIEIQTTGVMLDEDYLRFLRDWVGVTTISLSVSSFNDYTNNSIIGTPKNGYVELGVLAHNIKKLGFTLRLSINLTDAFINYTPEDIVIACKGYGANQITLRKMYYDGSETEQSLWVKNNTKYIQYERFSEYFAARQNCILRQLEYGQYVYDIDGISVVYDNDCMAKEVHTDELKYLILRPDCKLYSQWDSKASLIF